MNNELCVYRINVTVRGTTKVRRFMGWNGLDALDRASRKLRAEGNTSFKLKILDQTPIPK